MVNPLDDHYARIERETAAFSRETGVSCPPGCGVCCTAIDFGVSRPEALRVAEFLLDHPAILERFLAQKVEEPPTGKTQCPLYDPENEAAHCTVYEARPLLCRTFAFSAHREKDGSLAYAPCRKFREDEVRASLVEAARSGVRAGRGPKLPILPDDAMLLTSLDPTGTQLPMGPAVRRELELLRYRRAAQSTS